MVVCDLMQRLASSNTALTAAVALSSRGEGTRVWRALLLALRLRGCCRYPCVYCGPNTRYDFQRVEEDNEDEAYNIMDNLKAAVANK